MAATVTLSTTTLAAPVLVLDNAVILASTTGVSPGICLWMDRELMSVVSLGINRSVNVRRGIGGTSSCPHGSSITVTIGRPDQFYESDPVGAPPSPIPVSPWINTLTGDQWTAQGDETGPDEQARWWTKNATTHDTGALGVRTTTQAASSTTQY